MAKEKFIPPTPNCPICDIQCRLAHEGDYNNVFYIAFECDSCHYIISHAIPKEMRVQKWLI